MTKLTKSLYLIILVFKKKIYLNEVNFNLSQYLLHSCSSVKALIAFNPRSDEPNRLAIQLWITGSIIRTKNVSDYPALF
ncbi:hypothetical protein BpHYR1_001751 [Brachionus plicatilis]|uniref:Uncharacterized protein n=1 Tax=Brachionus plicatilis TaxID=10195 RepID=A0A3M7RC47_BRAPC|nr:hypothetical protein BpHYR1_001751 [Brachionus plicatilis]